MRNIGLEDSRQEWTNEVSHIIPFTDMKQTSTLYNNIKLSMTMCLVILDLEVLGAVQWITFIILCLWEDSISSHFPAVLVWDADKWSLSSYRLQEPKAVQFLSQSCWFSSNVWLLPEYAWFWGGGTENSEWLWGILWGFLSLELLHESWFYPEAFPSKASSGFSCPQLCPFPLSSWDPICFQDCTWLSLDSIYFLDSPLEPSNPLLLCLIALWECLELNLTVLETSMEADS